MTAAEFSVSIGYKTDYIERHRPILMQMEFMLLFVGLFFYVSGVTWPDVFKETTWGSIAYEMPAWLWGFVNIASATITIIGLKRPVRSWIVAAGSYLQTMQFCSIAISCLFSGGDFGIGLYAICFGILHGKMLYEAARSM